MFSWNYDVQVLYDFTDVRGFDFMRKDLLWNFIWITMGVILALACVSLYIDALTIPTWFRHVYAKVSHVGWFYGILVTYGLVRDETRGVYTCIWLGTGPGALPWVKVPKVLESRTRRVYTCIWLGIGRVPSLGWNSLKFDNRDWPGCPPLRWKSSKVASRL